MSTDAAFMTEMYSYQLQLTRNLTVELTTMPHAAAREVHTHKHRMAYVPARNASTEVIRMGFVWMSAL